MDRGDLAPAGDELFSHCQWIHPLSRWGICLSWRMMSCGHVMGRIWHERLALTIEWKAIATLSIFYCCKSTI